MVYVGGNPSHEFLVTLTDVFFTGAPAADFDRMVWATRVGGVFFLADDYIDSGKMLDRIPGFKKAASGTSEVRLFTSFECSFHNYNHLRSRQLFHPEDRAEVSHDVVFRAIKATCHPRTFNQLIKCTHEWWDSNVHEPFRNLDQYLAVRRVNIAMVSRFYTHLAGFIGLNSRLLVQYFAHGQYTSFPVVTYASKSPPFFQHTFATP